MSCAEPPQKESVQERKAELAFERLLPKEVPDFIDDLDTGSLRTAVQKSMEFYGRVPADRTYPLGNLSVSVEHLKATLTEFLRLMDAGKLNRESINGLFDVYRASHTASEAKPLVTGYYEPILEGRLAATKEFCCPLYGLPPDLLIIDLELFNPARYSGQRLVGRLNENRVVPYYNRHEIESLRKLDKYKKELVWLRDPVDVFFLHIQGSGMITFPGEKPRRVGYAGSNGRPYSSIGKVLMERGVISPEEVSLQSVRAYLRAHPEIRDEVFRHNESYVFFQWIQEGPRGSLNVDLTAGRSIASDPSHHPRGALAFLISEKPRLSANGEVTGWEPLHRWVLNQDTGGAIKGVGRVDLFCGSGETAEQMAGRLKQRGRLYFLLKKKDLEKQ